MDEQKLLILPCASEDIGSQRCRLSARVIQQVGGKLLSPAWIKMSRNVKVLCTLWPRRDMSDKYIQLNDLVRLESNGHNDKEDSNRCISLRDIEIIHSVDIVNVVHVEVIVKDYTKVQEWLHSRSDAKFKLMHTLRNIIICSGCRVNVKQTSFEKLFGLSWVIITKVICFNDSNLKYGKCGMHTDVYVSRVMSLEKYEQRQTSFTKKPGGLCHEIKVLKELIELKKLVRNTNPGLCLSLGILLQGPPGCGKTSLVHYVAMDTGSYLEVINGAEVFAARPGETEHNLQMAFEKAETISREGPCIILLDELDCLCPHRSRGRVEQRVVSRLLHLIEHAINTNSVIVIGATNNVGNLDPAIRRPGRLEKEILIGVPSLQQRRDILEVLTSDVPLDIDIDLSLLAESTPGYVGADLESLVQQAHYSAIAECLKQDKQIINSQEAILVKSRHFKEALHGITPSTQRGTDLLVDYKPIKWNDIGGLEDVKIKLKQTVEWPLKHPEAFTRLGLPCPRGILLYGPPGCGKTTIVRAMATSCHVTFLAISGGQLYSPYVGDSEQKLMQVFQQARAGAPTILFIDELDSVIGSRSQDRDKNGVQERILSTLLNEMDGIGIKADDIVRTAGKVAERQQLSQQEEVEFTAVDNNNVLLVAATNRPDLLDDAILRPGRIDHIIYVPPPDKEARVSILEVHTRKCPIDGITVEELAVRTEGYTGADLENLCREAALYALSEEGLSATTVSRHHFNHVLKTLKPSLTPEQIAKYSKMNIRSKSSSGI